MMTRIEWWDLRDYLRTLNGADLCLVLDAVASAVSPFEPAAENYVLRGRAALEQALAEHRQRRPTA